MISREQLLTLKKKLLMYQRRQLTNYSAMIKHREKEYIRINHENRLLERGQL